MINNKLIISIFIILILFSCKDNPTINVIETIRKYNLYIHHPSDATIENSLHGDGLLFFDIHKNPETDSCLYVLKNFKNDTLLVYLTKGTNTSYNPYIYKKDLYGNYYFLLKSYGDEAKKNLTNNTLTQIIDGNIKVFIIDTINHNMVPINRTPDSKIINHIKKQFDLKGDFYMVHSPIEPEFNCCSINALITIAKDTLDVYQSYYQVNAIFKPQKKDKKFELSPDFDEINHLGIFKENIGYWEGGIGNTKEAKIKYKYYYYYLDPIYNTYSVDKKLSKIEIISHQDNKESIIKTLKEEELFKINHYIESEIPRSTTSEFRPEMFRYYNGEYFITSFLPKQDEYIESIPPIYHLDTVKWKLNKLELFDPLVDKKYSSLQRKSQIDDITGNYIDTSLFLESLEIVKVNDEYRLIKKGI